MELDSSGSGRFERSVNVGRPGRHRVLTVVRVPFPMEKEAITIKQPLLMEYLLMCQVLCTDRFESLPQLGSQI